LQCWLLLIPGCHCQLFEWLFPADSSGDSSATTESGLYGASFASELYTTSPTEEIHGHDGQNNAAVSYNYVLAS
jgi:hypothetical protein